MIKGEANLKIVKDSSGILGDILKDLSGCSVLVGIPEEKSSRKGSGEITNAELLFIHTNGSPLRRIPARPVIEPAIEADGNKGPIIEELEQAAISFLNDKREQGIAHMKRAGMIASNACRAWFTDPRNGWPPNAESTVLRKLEKLKGGKLKAAMGAYEAGESSFAFQGQLYGLNTPLVDTGEMRAAITYVLKDPKTDGAL